ncbi:YDG domain-containing protein [Rhodanobacter sp. DHB23]|uniref:YDG domain-containing protein n=1 Tax=Rhodanobacter sp. DHB23 TaxID=2775923 RepID=UPI0017826DC7|nr:YDG domain-containing protein [Rhodanobacter sp. DHB23]MBD8872544.1 filamentous hemagglutinin N-terminal domain-containing protein [Rhodanobacter sp. DHB23]
MNRIFQLVWNRELCVLQVASELTRGHRKGGRSAEGGTRRAAWLAGIPLSLPLVALAAIPSPGIPVTGASPAVTAAVAANALPTGGQVTGGTGQLAQHGNTLTITQQSQNLSLNWQTFDIGSQSTVDFVQPNASAIAVNRIADTNGSRIFGHLDANGQVFLINPNGILFGKSAQVNVGGLVASTLDVDDNTLDTGSLSFSGTGKGSVTNLGTINVAGGGYAALLGNQVVNQGAIHAQLGAVALAGGSAVTLSFSGDKLVGVRVDQGALDALAQNGQLIEADGGNVWMTAGARDSLLASAVNNTGTIEAQTVQNRSGHIMLLGGMDAGTVGVGGTLDASAPDGGNGGQVETSAAQVNVADTARITTAARLGLAGTWLIDPSDFTVAPSGGNMTGATLTSELAGGPVTIQSSAGTAGGSGNINIDDNVSWSLHTLTLTAANNVNVNATMTASGTAGLAVNTATANGGDAAVTGGTLNMGLGSSGFVGQVNFTGSGNSLTINGHSYTLVNSASTLGGMGTSGFYALAGNLTLSGNFTPIGDSTTAFSGVFDGLGHTISGLSITNSTATDVGLFGASSGTIRNVGLLNESVSGTSQGASIGGLVGDNSGTINNVFMTGTVSGAGNPSNASDQGGGEWVGGLAGANESGGTISNAYATGAVTGSSYSANLGGLVGTNYGTIRNAYATGSVSGSYSGTLPEADNIGGLVGFNPGTIVNAYATGSVSSAKITYSGSNYGNAIGGLVGYNYGNGSITDTYATGTVSSPNTHDYLGGLVGEVNIPAGYTGKVTTSYWDTSNNSALPSGVGNGSTSGVAGLTTTQMEQASNFSGWSIATTGGQGLAWRIYAGDTTPLIESLLVPLTISASNQTVTYNGTNQDTAVVGYSLPSPNVSAITLGLTAAQHAGSHAENISSAYSTTYDLSIGTSSATLTINPATLTVSLTNTGVTKTYDGTTSAPSGFTPTYHVTGFVSGDTAATLSDTGAAYNNAHVAGATELTVSGLGITGVTGSNGSLAGDYTLASTSANVSASITPIVLAATAPTIGGITTKVYDGTTTAIGATLVGGSISGALGGDNLSLNTSGISLNYNSSHVATASSIGASGSLSVNILSSTHGSQSTDYSVAMPSIAAMAGTITPATLTATLTNSGVTKTYDGTTNAPAGFTPTYSYSGLVSGDTSASLSSTGIAYDSAHVASATEVTVSGLGITSVTGSNGSQASDYTLASGNASVAATITPAPLTVSLSNTTNVSKTYDGTASAPSGFTPTYSIAGLVPGDSATVSSSATPVFDSAHVASATAITQGGLSLASITGNGTDNSVLGDYTLASTTAATGAGIASIVPATLTATLTNSGVTKTYDGTTNAPAGFTPTYSYSGLVSGDTDANLSSTGIAYDSAHVASATEVTVSGLGITGVTGSNGSQATDYTLASGNASVAATITPAPLTLSLSNTTNVSKTYDGTTAAPSGFTPTYSIAGLVSGDSATVSSSATPVFDSAHVASATAITQGGLSLGSITGNGTDNSVLGDYTLASTTAATGAGIASISPLTLTVSAPTIGGSTTKVYDGSTTASGAILSGGGVSGALVGDDLSLDTSGITLDYNSSHVATASSIGASGSLAVDILSSTNGSQSTDYSVTLPSIAPVAGTITPAPLTAALTNTGVSKTYDGTIAAPAGFTPTYDVTGFVSGDTAATLTDTGAAYNSAHVATATDVTVSGLGITGIAGSNGSLASDYVLASTSANVAATITPAILTATLTNNGVTKTYDGTTSAPAGFTPTYSIIGFVSGDTAATLSNTGATYDSAHVATATEVTVSGLGITGVTGSNASLASDYTLASTSVYVPATITPATLTATLTNSGVTKTYDGTTNAPTGFTPTYDIAGFVSGDTAATLSDTGTAYDSAHVVSATEVTVSGLGIAGVTGSNGSQATDYTLASVNASVAATITPAPLTVSLSNTTNVTKTYDGTTAAPSGFTPTYSIAGLVSGDSATVSSSATPVFDSAHVVSATMIAQTGLSLSAIIGNGSDNSVIGDYTLSSTTASTGIGVASISPLTLTVLAPTIGGITTKVYDGTTTAAGAILSGGSVSGAIGGDSLSLNTSGITLDYNSSHVATASSIGASGSLSVDILGSTNGSLSTDYSVALPAIAPVAGTITPATLTATLTNSGVTKTYDGTTSAPAGFTPTYDVTGFVSGDTAATLSNTGSVYDSAHVATATEVTVSGLGITNVIGSNGSLASDYALASTSANVAATITPATLTATLTNTGVTKTYDGTTSAPAGFTPTYDVTGFVSGDTAATLSDTGAAYNSAHVASATGVTVSGLGITGIAGSNGSLASDYALASTNANVAATITPATLTAALTNSGVTKTYDGTTNAPAGFTPTYDITGFVSGDTAATLSDTGAAYDSAHVATATDVTVSGLGITGIAGSNGSLASDYVLASTSANVAATITPATLTATLTNTGVTKTYDGTTSAPAGFTPTYSITGFVPGDTAATLSNAGSVYDSAHVATATGVTVSGVGITSVTGSNASQASDYTLASTSANVAATITPATLTATLTNSGVTKTYDGTTSAPVGFTPTYDITGFVSGDTAATLSSTGTAYDSAHVTTATEVTVSGLGITGVTGSNASQASDYTLASTSLYVPATITPATLTATLTNTGVTKTYDGTTNAPAGFTPTYDVTGFVSGDTGATLSDTGAAYDSAHVASASAVTVSGLGIADVTGGNASLASDYVLASTSANIAATITPATLTTTLTNTGVIKAYDGTTSAPAGFTPTYDVTGFVSGDTAATLTDTGAAYNSAHVATATDVTVSGLGITGIAGSNGSLASDYVLASTSANVAATITPATLTATLTNSGVTKTYDGTTSAPAGFTPTYDVTGFVSGDTAATLSDTGAAYDSAHVAAATEVTVSGLGITGIAGSNGSLASDYVLASTSTNVAATITPATLTATLTNTGVTKTYDGTTSAPAGFTPAYGYSGLVSGDTGATLTDTGAAYNSSQVSSATNVTVTGLGIGSITGSVGSLASDYALAANSASVAATITPAVLTASLTGQISKVYDGTSAATLASGNYLLTGVIGGDAVSLDTPSSGTYASANAGSGIDVQVGGLAISGSAAGNYVLGNGTASAAIGTITPARLTVTANNASAIYDAQPYSGGNGVTYSGFVDGQTAAVLGGALGYGGNSQGAMNVGNYAITPAGLSSDNYTITYDSGRLAITPATLTYVATPVQVYAGQAIPALGGTVTGFQGSDTLADATTGTLGFATQATAQSPAGQYAIIGSGLAANDGNYTFVQAAGNALAFNVAPDSATALPGVATAQQLLGQAAPAGIASLPGGLLVSAAASPDESLPATMPPRSATAPAGSDLYAPDVRVVSGGVRLP